ncbi:MAG: TGS domain-containing protein, partial [Candidatus Obscuribacterales bacterium]|nr:TGS domain-containing protein [Candidatus Obscuribacterales bacterium]
ITLPDGSQRSFDHPVSVAEVAASIGAGLAKATVAGKVNGNLVDASDIIDSDASLQIKLHCFENSPNAACSEHFKQLVAPIYELSDLRKSCCCQAV